jgi:hypothetical protein
MRAWKQHCTVWATQERRCAAQHPTQGLPFWTTTTSTSMVRTCVQSCSSGQGAWQVLHPNFCVHSGSGAQHISVMLLYFVTGLQSACRLPVGGAVRVHWFTHTCACLCDCPKPFSTHSTAQL